MFDIAELSNTGGKIIRMFRDRSGNVSFDIGYGGEQIVQGTIPPDKVRPTLQSLAIRYGLINKDEQLTDFDRVITFLKSVPHLSPAAVVTLLNAAFDGQAGNYRQKLAPRR